MVKYNSYNYQCSGSYGVLTTILMTAYSDGITAAGSSFAGMGISALPTVFVYGFVRTGLSEELFFRGFLLKTISSRWGFAAGNTIQTVFFGALHGIPFGIATHNILVTIMLTLLPGAFGWYQGWLNEKRCGESIVPSWLLHGTINTIVACLSL
ncbi:MAG: CPBP family intramembrane metalloprotease [Lachnospiraceae bacterium]|nr:CPBP family intramembrane metalloprotease [Lachnospiraceae bacterium]